MSTKTFRLEADATFGANDVADALVVLADHLRQMAGDEPEDDGLIESGHIKLRAEHGGFSEEREQVFVLCQQAFDYLEKYFRYVGDHAMVDANVVLAYQRIRDALAPRYRG